MLMRLFSANRAGSAQPSQPTQLSQLPQASRPFFRFASQCAVCKSWPAAPVCAACVRRFAPPTLRCIGCAALLPPDWLQSGHRADYCIDCLRHPPPVDRAFAAVGYAFPWSTLVASYKYGAQPGWAPVFARLLLETPGVQGAFDELQAADWIVPVPLSSERLQTRGFNQAWQLARALAAAAHTAATPDAALLLRIRDTRPQSQLTKSERLANVHGALAVEPLRAAALTGRRVVLVDDVMTSGASVYAAARALREAGADQVTAIVFARTENA